MAEKQIFIKMENYNDAADVIELIKNKIKESKDVLQKLKQTKNQEDMFISQWASEIEELEKKFANLTELFAESTGE